MFKTSSLIRSKAFAYFVLTARVLLAWTFLRYGFSKLTSDQFGLTDAELLMPLRDVSLFQLSWYLFDHQPFKAFIGMAQIVCGTLLLINRTALLGALLFLPICATILIIDLSFMPPGLAYAFAWRLGYYLILDVIIIYSYKHLLNLKLREALFPKPVGSTFSWWAYVALPLAAIVLEIIGALPKITINLILRPETTIESISRIPLLVKGLFEHLVG